MKVCTDACLMGACIPLNGPLNRILDIGSGTGLLSLMMAQRTTAKIDAVEIEELAANQSKQNVQNSPWSERINVFHTSIQLFHPADTYDLIFSNPPFFSNNLKSSSKSYNVASHSDALSMEELANLSAAWLSDLGSLVVMYPAYEALEFRKVAYRLGLHNDHLTSIRNTSKSGTLRVIQRFTKKPVNQITEEEVIIRNDDGQYSEQFRRYLKDFYTIF